MTQNRRLGTPFVAAVTPESLARDYDVVVDAVFGFSFVMTSDGVRAPFDALLRTLRATALPVVSIDIPSGWDVERGDVFGVGLRPSVLISLTAPKLCARFLDRARTRHLLAGRFVPRCVTSPPSRRRMWSSLTSTHGSRRACVRGRRWWDVTSEMDLAHQLNLPPYPGTRQYVDISALATTGTASAPAGSPMM